MRVCVCVCVGGGGGAGMEWAGGVSDICIGSMWEIGGGDFLGMGLASVVGVWRFDVETSKVGRRSAA